MLTRSPFLAVGHEVLTTGSCGLIYFLFFFSIHSNVIVMVVMTAERYLAISHPLQAGQWFSKRKAQLAVVVTWILVLMIDLHHLIIRRMDWNEALQVIFSTWTFLLSPYLE